MDREAREHYSVVIQAKDMAGQVGGLSGSTTVNITLTDVNDNPPRFPQSIYREDRITGWFTMLTPLNYEKKKSYTLNIEGANTHLDFRFSHLGPFKDATMLKIIVGDVDEPPLFSMPFYVMEVYENAKIGTIVGTVLAQDPDSANSLVRYFIDYNAEDDRFFNIDANTGTIKTTKILDREETPWYNITVAASENDNPGLLSHVTVGIRVLDVNDNPPELAREYDIVVCENSKPGQCSSLGEGVISSRMMALQCSSPGEGALVSVVALELGRMAATEGVVVAVQRREGAEAQSRVCRHAGEPQRRTCPGPLVTAGAQSPLSPAQSLQAGLSRAATPQATRPASPGSREGSRVPARTAARRERQGRLQCKMHYFVIGSNYLVRKGNRDNTASILTRRRRFSRTIQDVYYLPIMISDGGIPSLSSSSTLTIRVCACERDGRVRTCHAEAFLSSAGLSTGALIAILLCVVILLAIVVLFITLRRSKKEHLIISEEDVRENVVTYDDEGGGEEDTEAFDITALRNPSAAEELKYRRDIRPEVKLTPRHQTLSTLESIDVQEFIKQRLAEADLDPSVPPYDSLQTYAYEGQRSEAGSISSLDSAMTQSDQDYHYLGDWGPEFKKLAELYGEIESERTT
ncbi:cadherin-18-like [Trichechus manatus latirostris]|uniref:Cadherin-18-like n=1 Tax=Trichechus manatus latirostris TaxID=127582 RepID=A0A2Y9ECD9_TRIMA|nr:cadherin-18-like [Trichechus manatus latirostris]